MSQRWSAHELLDLVLDEGSFESWDQPVDLILRRLRATRPSSRRPRRRPAPTSRCSPAAALVRGRPVAVVVNEFRFLAGSIGRAAADRIIAAVRRATAEGLPAARHHRVGRHPHAGGHARLRADGGDLPRADGPPRRRPALPRPPAPPHDRRRLRLVGLARPRDRRRARRAGRASSAPRSTRPQRAAVPTGRPGRREPRRAGRHRRGRGRRGPARLVDRALARARRPARRGPAAAARLAPGRRPAPRWDASSGPAHGPARACATCSPTAPPARCSCAAPTRASATRPCSSR